MTKVDVAKFVVSTVVSIGSGKIVNKIIYNNVTPVGLVNKITVSAAAITIGWILSDTLKKKTDSAIEDFATSFSSSETKYE